MDRENIPPFTQEVNHTKDMSKTMTWPEIGKFIVIGMAKLGAFAAVIWILRHF